MKNKINTYAVFFAVLTAVIVIWRLVEYSDGGVVAVCLATVAVSRSVRSLSLPILFAIVFLETALLPISFLMLVSHGTLTSVMGNFFSATWIHIRMLIHLVLPLVVLVGLVTYFRSSGGTEKLKA